MKSDLYNDEVNNFLSAAEQIARELNHSFIGSGHVIFAMLSNKEDSSLSEIECIASFKLRITAEDFTGRGALRSSSEAKSKLVVTPILLKTLVKAEQLAVTSHSNLVNAKHLLEAICDVSSSIIDRILSANQTKPTEFRKQLKDQLHLE